MKRSQSPHQLTALAGALFVLGAAGAAAASTYEFRAPKKGLAVSTAPSQGGSDPTPAPALTRTVSLSSSTLDFEGVSVGASKKAQVLLSNTGTGSVTLSGVTVSGSGAFSVSTECGSSLAVGASCLSEVTFAPAARGSLSGTLVLSSDATNGPATASLAGVGLQAEGALAAAIDSSFGSVTVGATAVRTFTFTNIGNDSATGVYPMLTGSGLSFTANTCGTQASPTTLAANDSCSMTVQFAPTSAGALSGAALSVTSSAVNSPSTLSLSGTGLTSNVQASGGTVLTPGDGYRYHVFTTTGASTFTITSNASNATVDYLVVAGGGAGGRGQSGSLNPGGGGAGGVLTSSAVLGAGSYSITVGAGGSSSLLTNGSNSVLSYGSTVLTAIGGGLGAGLGNGTPGSGGSGGGGYGSGNGTVRGGGAGTAGQGYAGGSGQGSGFGGGGGGAAAVGGNGSNVTSTSGAGGAGVYLSKFTVAGSPAGYYGGGGGGGACQTRSGGVGGGGQANASGAGSDGTANTGGGGGGGCAVGSTPGGNGGSGIVIVRYPYQ